MRQINAARIRVMAQRALYVAARYGCRRRDFIPVDVNMLGRFCNVHDDDDDLRVMSRRHADQFDGIASFLDFGSLKAFRHVVDGSGHGCDGQRLDGIGARLLLEVSVIRWESVFECLLWDWSDEKWGFVTRRLAGRLWRRVYAEALQTHNGSASVWMLATACHYVRSLPKVDVSGEGRDKIALYFVRKSLVPESVHPDGPFAILRDVFCCHQTCSAISAPKLHMPENCMELIATHCPVASLPSTLRRVVCYIDMYARRDSTDFSTSIGFVAMPRPLQLPHLTHLTLLGQYRFTCKIRVDLPSLVVLETDVLDLRGFKCAPSILILRDMIDNPKIGHALSLCRVRELRIHAPARRVDVSWVRAFELPRTMETVAFERCHYAFHMCGGSDRIRVKNMTFVDVSKSCAHWVRSTFAMGDIVELSTLSASAVCDRDADDHGALAVVLSEAACFRLRCDLQHLDRFKGHACLRSLSLMDGPVVEDVRHAELALMHAVSLENLAIRLRFERGSIAAAHTKIQLPPSVLRVVIEAHNDLATPLVECTNARFVCLFSGQSRVALRFRREKRGRDNQRQAARVHVVIVATNVRTSRFAVSRGVLDSKRHATTAVLPDDLEFDDEFQKLNHKSNVHFLPDRKEFMYRIANLIMQGLTPNVDSIIELT